MEKRKLKELNLIDNFLFSSVVTYPGIGEEFGQKLLEIIFQREFVDRIKKTMESESHS